MGWYSTNYKKRVPITVINTAGGSAYDATVAIPDTWDDFWDTIDASGDGIRVTAADGVTLLDYEWAAGFNATTRAGTLELDNVAAPNTANAICCLWLYYDATVAADGSTTVAPSTPETGYIDEARPSYLSQVVRAQAPGRAQPGRAIGKSSTEEIDVWLDLSAVLEQRSTPSARRPALEEPRSVVLSAVDSGGSAAATLVDAPKCRFVEVVAGGGRRIYLRARVKAGTTGTSYTIIPILSTARPGVSGVHRVLESGLRIGVRVVNQIQS